MPSHGDILNCAVNIECAVCKAQALRKAYFDLLRGIDQCVVSSSKYGNCLILSPVNTYISHKQYNDNKYPALQLLFYNILTVIPLSKH